MTVYRIVITPSLDKEGRPRRSSKGALYDARYEGQVIVLNSTEPGLDAARLLRAKGHSGTVEIWDSVLPYCRFRTEIDKGAGLTVREGDGLPRLVKFKSFAPRHAQDGNFAPKGIPVAQTRKSRPGESPAPLAGTPAEVAR